MVGADERIATIQKAKELESTKAGEEIATLAKKSKELESKLSQAQAAAEAVGRSDQRQAELTQLKGSFDLQSKKLLDTETELLQMKRGLESAESRIQQHQAELTSLRMTKSNLEKELKAKLSIKKDSPVGKVGAGSKPELQKELETINTTLKNMVDTSTVLPEYLQSSPAAQSSQTDYERLGFSDLKSKVERLLAENSSLRQRLSSACQTSLSKNREGHRVIKQVMAGLQRIGEMFNQPEEVDSEKLVQSQQLLSLCLVRIYTGLLLGNNKDKALVDPLLNNLDSCWSNQHAVSQITSLEASPSEESFKQSMENLLADLESGSFHLNIPEILSFYYRIARRIRLGLLKESFSLGQIPIKVESHDLKADHPNIQTQNVPRWNDSQRSAFRDPSGQEGQSLFRNVPFATRPLPSLEQEANSSAASNSSKLNQFNKDNPITGYKTNPFAGPTWGLPKPLPANQSHHQQASNDPFGLRASNPGQNPGVGAVGKEMAKIVVAKPIYPPNKRESLWKSSGPEKQDEATKHTQNLSKSLGPDMLGKRRSPPIKQAQTFEVVELSSADEVENVSSKRSLSRESQNSIDKMIEEAGKLSKKKGAKKPMPLAVSGEGSAKKASDKMRGRSTSSNKSSIKDDGLKRRPPTRRHPIQEAKDEHS